MVTNPIPLVFFLALSVGLACNSIGAVKQEVYTAVFSREQALWPEVFAAPKQPVRDSLTVIVVPPPPPQLDESPPCDSCDRLAPNVLEFFLPAWHRDLFAAWLPKTSHVEVLSGGNPLLMGDTTLTQAEPTLPALPYAVWLPKPSQHKVIYRPRDRWMPDSARALFSGLGGRLGATHLLFIDSVKVRLRPWRRSSERGSFQLGFYLVFFDVARGRPEWVKQITLKGSWWNDLDAPLEPRLEPGYQAWKKAMPALLEALWNAEPR